MDTNEVIRYLPVTITPEEKHELETEVAEIDVAEFRQELIKDAATDEMKTLKEKRRIIAAKLSSGSETKEVVCEWDFQPDMDFKKGEIKPQLYPDRDEENREKWEETGKGFKMLFRKDTGDIVEQEPMDAEDFQESLPLEADEKPKSNKKKESSMSLA